MTRARSFRSWGSWLALVAIVSTSACESSRYDRVELHRTGGHPEAEIDPGGLTVPEGGVLVFRAQPRAEVSSPEYEGLERFKLTPSDSSVATAHRAILRDTWVVSGMSIGSTQLLVIVDGDVVDEVPVEIVAPEEDGQ
jgi:hypothetical protein